MRAAACDELARATRRIQEQTLLRLVRKASQTRFGRDHQFAAIRSVADFQRAVPVRTYEAIWEEYLRDAYPVFDNLTWPGRIPFLALTSGTTEGATKYIPVSAEMVASNRKAAQTALAFYLRSRPESRLFHGRIFFLGGSTDLNEPAPGVLEGDLSGIAAVSSRRSCGPTCFRPSSWLSKPTGTVSSLNWPREVSATDHAGQRRSRLAARTVSAVLDLTGKNTVAEVWPHLELVVHGGVKFDPYRESFATILGSPAIRLQEVYPCSEGFIAFGDPATGLLRLVFDHGLFFEFVPVADLGSPHPTRHWLGTARNGR